MKLKKGQKAKSSISTKAYLGFLERIWDKDTEFLLNFVPVWLNALLIRTHFMKRILGIFLLILTLACDSDRPERNPFLQEIGFRFEINLNLPLYSPLTNPGNPVYIGTQGVGIRGVFVINTGFDQYRAFEATCPNHIPSSCSTMEIASQTAVCPCEDYEYSLFTGQQTNRPDDGMRYYNMLEYRATPSGSNVVVITN